MEENNNNLNKTISTEECKLDNSAIHNDDNNIVSSDENSDLFSKFVLKRSMSDDDKLIRKIESTGRLIIFGMHRKKKKNPFMVIAITGSGHTKFSNADTAVHEYLQKIKICNQNTSAIEMLKWLRSQIFALLGEDEDNCRIAIYVDSHDNLDCVIGSGKKKIVINIIGDNMQFTIAGRNPVIQTTTYSNLLKMLMNNEQLQITN
ncbi:unnamed protein product [Mytilus edulis]|uniref:Uncharacterized protein n=1 Tax=Mytilus edulis TaxID=6550 RepID=A0A8S3SSH9_MYTED|nr:unnamed protein product [Mytilus edulis]